ncbi:MAG: DUF3368 domain-containing protein [Bacteroidetes bacterium]|jgi:predicted nucleic acid-binding protein|nr:DUF3368 domain-containing protein [Bacteroidota bacterium]
MTVVTNAGPLIALARIRQLPLLPALYGEVIMPSAVRDEVLDTDERREGTAMLQEAEWLHTHSVSDRIAVALLRERLDAGESETIVLALQLDADVVLMDEARGRRVAAARGIAVTGTLGTLLLANEKGLIDRVAPHLARLQDEGFYMSTTLYEKVLKRAGEA